jgi:T4 RnlA family RNA ligase
MNDYQMQLWNDLSALVKSNDAFYSVDQELDGITYRVFSYRLASYTDFLSPGALESRGIMFELINSNEPRRLASMPMPKFFNLFENPRTMNLDLSQVKDAMLKADGSLISSYMHAGVLRLKSKTSLASDQAVCAMKFLDENVELKNEVEQLTSMEYTVNMEWCSPDNRIVIGYLIPQLVILNVRDNNTGEYIEYNELPSNVENVRRAWVDVIGVEDPVSFVENAKGETGIEGYVVRLNDGTWFKLKNEWYLKLHKNKDSVNSQKKLFEAVLYETSDDLKSLFHDDPVSMKLIEDMEVLVSHAYNHLVVTVENFYQKNKNLERKDYAIKGQAELAGPEFGLAMMMYLDKDVDFKKALMRRVDALLSESQDLSEE